MSTATGTKPLVTREVRIDRLNRAVESDPDFQHLRYRNRSVKGRGSLYPEILFIRAVPTISDAQVGEAYYGNLRIYTDLLAMTGLGHDHAYFTHLLKYRPPQGRVPRLAELVASRRHILEEISILRPKIVIPMGVVPTRFFLPNERMADVKGKPFKARKGKYLVVPTFDPDITLIDPSTRGMIYGDIKIVRELI